MEGGMTYPPALIATGPVKGVTSGWRLGFYSTVAAGGVGSMMLAIHPIAEEKGGKCGVKTFAADSPRPNDKRPTPSPALRRSKEGLGSGLSEQIVFSIMVLDPLMRR